jgi:hypothetical protein
MVGYLFSLGVHISGKRDSEQFRLSPMISYKFEEKRICDREWSYSAAVMVVRRWSNWRVVVLGSHVSLPVSGYGEKLSV